ncbi:MAG: glycosyltransferase family 4 protein [Anaerolineae bacterium]|nr:glycosyltransferase family 4 protein [Anaerolineae bacterium]
MRQEKPNIIHTHLPRADLLGFAIRSIGTETRWVASVHAIYSKSWRGHWALPLWGALWKRADRLIAISKAVKDWLAGSYRIPEEKVQVVYYGIEPECFRTPSQNFRDAFGIHDEPIIGTVGRLEFGKGYDVLICAMPFVLRQVPKATLLIAGHDPWGYGQKLQEMIDQMGLKSHVRLVGFQSDVCSFLHALDVFAFASRSEGFGQVLIEAMAVGRPIVASRTSPITEIVIDGVTGILVEPENPKAFAEAIIWFLSDSKEKEQMIRRGMERVRELFSAERMARETLAVYDQVLGIK